MTDMLLPWYHAEQRDANVMPRNKTILPLHTIAPVSHDSYMLASSPRSDPLLTPTGTQNSYFP